MGIVHRGIPRQRALEVRDEFRLKCFVETGTHVGHTALWAADHFEKVLTVEANQGYYWTAVERLRQHANVKVIWGYSGTELRQMLDEISGPALIWLDAHWSPDLKYERPIIVCPVLAEIKAIQISGRPHVVFIDDARLFGDAGWPSIKSIYDSFGDRWQLQIKDDVIECFPKMPLRWYRST